MILNMLEAGRCLPICDAQHRNSPKVFSDVSSNMSFRHLVQQEGTILKVMIFHNLNARPFQNVWRIKMLIILCRIYRTYTYEINTVAEVFQLPTHLLRESTGLIMQFKTVLL